MREIDADERLSSDVVANTIVAIEAASKVIELCIAASEEPLVVIFASEEEAEGFVSFDGLHTAPIGDEFGKSVT